MHTKLVVLALVSILHSCILELGNGECGETVSTKISAMFIAANPGIDARIVLGGTAATGIKLQICKNPPFAERNHENINIDFLSGVDVPITDFEVLNFNITNLQGVRNFKLESLLIETDKKTILDISPLRGMPLKRLTILNPQSVENYAILSTLPVEMLALRIHEFPRPLQTVIGKLPLKDLSIEHANINNIDFVTKLPLENLYLNKVNVSSLEPIQNKALKSLAIYNSPIVDLTPLRTLPLEKLTIVNCPVKDLSPLAKCPLKRVTLTNIPVGIKELAVLFDKQLFSYDISISGWNVDGSWRAK